MVMCFTYTFFLLDLLQCKIKPLIDGKTNVEIPMSDRHGYVFKTCLRGIFNEHQQFHSYGKIH